MTKIMRALFLLLGGILVSSVVLAEEIECPNVQDRFESWPQRDPSGMVKFEFIIPPGGGRWTPVSLYVTTTVPLGEPSRTTPILEVVYPIHLSKDAGDYTITCIYKENGKYGRQVGNIPSSTLTIKAEEVKECYLKNARVVTCTR